MFCDLKNGFQPYMFIVAHSPMLEASKVQDRMSFASMTLSVYVCVHALKGK